MKKAESYGLLGTGLWFLLIACVFIFIQSLVIGFYAGATIYAGAETPTPEQIEAIMLELPLNGNVVAWATILSGFVCTLLVFLAIKLKKASSISVYLGFIKTDQSTYLRWIIVFAAVLLASEGLTFLVGKDSVPSDMIIIYQSASPIWFLWFAIVLVAPIFEEILFRGFLFKSLSNSVFGWVGAIVITAAIWASIHVQYEVYYIGIIFVWGLIFGYIRHKTASLTIPITLHILTNLISMLQTHYI